MSDRNQALIADIAFTLASRRAGNTSDACALEQIIDFMVAEGWTQFAPGFTNYDPSRSIRRTAEAPPRDWPQPATQVSEPRETCKVCYAEEDDDGEIHHGKGCYVENEDGGGVTFTGRSRL